MLPSEALGHAIKEACKSPCLSKRGVVIFRRNGLLLSRGHNHQPAPFICTGDAACKANCGKSAVHAEQQAILEALSTGCNIKGACLLHVKVKDDDRAVYSGPPSCLECSKLILAAGIGEVWLWHDPIFQQYSRFGEMQPDGLTRYTAEEFHRTCQHHGISLVQCPYEEYVEAL